MKLLIDIKYYVDENSKTVVAKPVDSLFDIDEYIDCHKKRQDILTAIGPIYIGDLTGKAVCSASDEFDEFIGHMIAKTKLMAKVYKRLRNALDDEIISLQKAQKQFVFFEEELNTKIFGTQAKLERIMNSLKVL